MTAKHAVLLAAFLVVPVLASACGATGGDEGSGPSPLSITRVEGTNKDLVQLTTRASERLAIQTAKVRGDGDGSQRTLIPYAAVLYDPNGQTWTFTSPRNRAFLRADIVVDRVENGTAILAKGPPIGTPVVTVGATELWGAVYGGIKED